MRIGAKSFLGFCDQYAVFLSQFFNKLIFPDDFGNDHSWDYTITAILDQLPSKRDGPARLFQDTVNTGGGQLPVNLQPNLHLARIVDLIGHDAKRVAVQVRTARAKHRPVEKVENFPAYLNPTT